MLRETKETLIYRFKHRDYKGKFEGKRSIMPPFNFNNKTCLVFLEDLSDDDFERLWSLDNSNNYLVRKEQKRKGTQEFIIHDFNGYHGVWASEKGWRKCQPLEIFNTRNQAEEYEQELLGNN